LARTPEGAIDTITRRDRGASDRATHFATLYHMSLMVPAYWR
jgi:hypothetical protein